MSTDGSTGGPAASTGGAASTAGGGGFQWGDGWRNHMAVELSTAPGVADPNVLKRLERFESPSRIFGSVREFEGKLSRGEYRSAQPKQGAAPDEITRWRAENGVPAKPEDYKITMPAGRQPPKEDDAFLKGFLTSAHANHYTQGQVDSAISSFYAEVDRQAQLTTDGEKQAADAALEKLRGAWGGDYQPNMAMAEALLARAPAGFRDRFMNGYLADGVQIKAVPEAWQWLVQMEREINPAATVLPGVTANVGQTIEAELAELKKEMAIDNSPYWKGPEAEKKQARYRELVDAGNKLRAKAA